jgi:hypothetical protein
MSLVKIQVRRDTAANWTASNPVLAAGEPGFETDTGKVKYGDGVRNWATLPYSSGVSLATEAPPEAGSPSAGSSGLAARADHTHALPESLATKNLTASGSATVGGSLTVAGALVGGSHKHQPSDIVDLSGAVFRQLVATLRAGDNVSTFVDPAAQTITLSSSGSASALPLVITSDPEDVASSDGTARFFARAIGGTTTIAYQWEQSADNGVTWADVDGATGASLARANLTSLSDGVQYRVRVTSGGEVVRSLAATLRVAGISITSHPADIRAEVGDFVFLQVAANAGSAAVSYQWQTRPNSTSAWTDVAGATSSTYTYRAGSATSATGVQFRASASALGAVVHSRAATVVIDAERMAFTLQPQSTLDSGGAATFSAEWTGGRSPITARWQRLGGGSGTWSQSSAFSDIPDGTSGVSGQDTATLALTAQTSSQHLRQYRLRITDADGYSVLSDHATLRTLSLVIVSGPVPVSAPAGATIAADAFEVAATADGAITYQWQSSTDGGTTWTNIAGATSATYGNIAVASADNGKLYRCNVTGDGQTLPTNSAALTVAPVPVTIASQPSDAAVAGGTATFTFSYAGGQVGATPTIRWERGTAATNPTSLGYIDGATTTTLTLGPNVPVSSNGMRIRGVVMIAGASAVTNWVTLTVPGGTFVTQPQSTTTSTATASFSFTYAPTACASPVIAWQRRPSTAGAWTTVSGATTTTLSLTGLVTGDSGSQFRASVACGAETSYTNVVTLTVLPPTLTITTQPLDATPSSGQATFSFAFAGGDGSSPVVQWERSVGGLPWATIPQATTTTLLLTGITSALDGSQYRAVVTVGSQSSTTRAATLTVSGATITLHPADTTTSTGNATLLMDFTTTACPTAQIEWERANVGTSVYEVLSGSQGSKSLSIVGILPGGSFLYRASVLCGGVKTYTRTATVTASSYSVFVSQPQSRSAPINTAVTFAFVTSLPAGTYTVKWFYAQSGVVREYVAGRNLTSISISATSQFVGTTWRAELTSVAGGFVATSAEAQLDIGVTTSISQIPVVGAAEVNGVAYAKKHFVAVTSDTTALCRRSADGLNWTTAFLPSSRRWDAIVATSTGTLLAAASGTCAQGYVRFYNTFDNFNNLVPQSQIVLRTTGTSGTIARSTDGGATWSTLAIPFFLGENARLWSFPHNNTTVLAFTGQTSTANIGGVSYWQATYSSNNSISSHAFRGGPGKIAVTTNDGASWTVFDLWAPPPAAPLSSLKPGASQFISQVAVSASGQVAVAGYDGIYKDVTNRVGARTAKFYGTGRRMLYGSIAGSASLTGWQALQRADDAIASVWSSSYTGWSAATAGIVSRPRSDAMPSGTPISIHDMTSVAHVADRGFIASHDTMPAVMVSTDGKSWGAVPATLAVGSLPFFDRGTEVLAVDGTRRVARLTAASYPNFVPTELTVVDALDQVNAWASSGNETLLTERAGRLTYIPTDDPPPAVSSGAPNAPSNVNPVPANGAIFVNWSAPEPKVAPDPYPTSSNPTTGYVLQYRLVSSAEWVAVAYPANNGLFPSPTNPDAASFGFWRVSGLQNGSSYVLRVAAVNQRGQGDWSVASSPVLPTVTAPSSPLSPRIESVTATPGSFFLRNVRVSWGTPSDNGGAPITGYAVVIVTVSNGYRSQTFEFPATVNTGTVSLAVPQNQFIRAEVLARNASNPAPAWQGGASGTPNFLVP